MAAANLGKWMFLAGVAVAAVGGLVWLAGKAGVPIGRLPGDVRVEREHFSFYVPLVTCLILSLALTLALNLILRLFRK